MKFIAYDEKYFTNKVEYKSPVIKARYANVIPAGYTKKEWETKQAEESAKMMEQYQQEIKHMEEMRPNDDSINLDMF